MKTVTRLGDLSQGRTDMFRLDPRIIVVDKGFNVRNFETPEMKQRIQDMARSIAEIGVTSPIRVRYEDGKAILVQGETRLRATLLAIKNGAQIESIPAYSEARGTSPADRQLGLLVDNEGRNLTPLEQAVPVARLAALGWSTEKIAAQAGKTKQYIESLLDLNATSDEVKEAVRAGEVSGTEVIKAIRSNRGDVQKAEEDVKVGITVAKAAGKKKATAKHISKPPSAKKRARSSDRYFEVLPQIIYDALKKEQIDYDFRTIQAVLKVGFVICEVS